MTVLFLIIAAVTVAGAIAAVAFRQTVHCALGLVVSLAGLAVLYLQLGAQFVSFAQVLVYVGAVAILIVFAMLLTRSAEAAPHVAIASRGWLLGLAIAGGTFAMLIAAIRASRLAAAEPSAVEPSATVRAIGTQLMENYIIPLEVIALLLTAALIGAVVIAWQERSRP